MLDCTSRLPSKLCPSFPPSIAVKEVNGNKKGGVRSISINGGAIKWDRWRGVNYGSKEWFSPKVLMW